MEKPKVGFKSHLHSTCLILSNILYVIGCYLRMLFIKYNITLK